MLHFHELLLFIVASLAINIIPGPDMLFVMARTMSNHKRGGFLSVAGISTGLLIHTFIVASGLSLIILHSHLAYQLIKCAGSIYLIYLGIKLLFAKHSVLTDDQLEASKGKDFTIFKQALLTNLLNPKIIVFFFAFLPQFANPQNGPLFLQLIYLGLLFIFTGTAVNSLVVLGTHKVKSKLENNPLYQYVQEKIAGTIMILLGLRLLILK